MKKLCPSGSPHLRALPILACAILGLLPACGGTVEQIAAGATTGGGGGGAVSSANSASSVGSASSAASSSGSGGGPSSASSVRFANLSVELAPFDVCEGGTGSALLAAHGLAAGLQFGQVSRYLPAAAGAAWALVPPGASCGDPGGVPLSIPWPTGAGSAPVTVVLWRATGAALAYAFVDEPKNEQYGIDVRVLDFAVMATPSSVQVPIRVLMQGPADPAPVTLFSHLAFAAVPTASPMGPVNEAGFAHTPGVEVGTLDVIPEAFAESFATTGPVSIPAQGNGYGVASIFVAGALNDGTARAVVCADDAPAVGALSACTIPPN